MRAAPRTSTQTEVLAGLVDRVTFHNSENGFCVLRVKARGQRDLITIIGHAAMISAGEFVQAGGSWINDRTHGLQFRASFLKATAPTTVEGIEKYLGSSPSGALCQFNWIAFARLGDETRRIPMTRISRRAAGLSSAPAPAAALATGSGVRGRLLSIPHCGCRPRPSGGDLGEHNRDPRSYRCNGDRPSPELAFCGACRQRRR
jgi:hypothetical protein